MNFKINRRATFYIYLSALIMLVLFLVIELISAIYFPIGVAKQLLYGERVSHHYSFFTTQSNYLVTIYFATFLYFWHFKRTMPTFQVRLAVTVYMTITMLIFWLGIITYKSPIGEYTFYRWIATIVLHLIMPIIMITNFVITSGKEWITVKTWHHNYLWLIGLYPAVYSFVIIIRGHLRYLDNKPESTWYPYFFFNIDQPYGWLIAPVAIVIIFGLVFGLQYFYIWVNNLMYKRIQKQLRKQRKRLENYYGKTWEKVQEQKK